jgi:3-isopropylmalate/(R)-2-methylmalate dehydratase small subunit
VQPFATLCGIAVPLEEANLDTNQLCPTRFNKVPNGPRFAQILLHDRRFNADGSEKPNAGAISAFEDDAKKSFPWLYS